jgi:hypothetical protein
MIMKIIKSIFEKLLEVISKMGKIGETQKMRLTYGTNRRAMGNP